MHRVIAPFDEEVERLDDDINFAISAHAEFVARIVLSEVRVARYFEMTLPNARCIHQVRVRLRLVA
ncbi:hypothetical protein LK996_12195 [Lysobacter sp. A6]|uniref:Uncharacterized protein n=1 Tax=Noviluteimonas lactosilytica TaxID=2888523 RepID=A0ABS8JJY3_9GAMM|nr:hypothetical protein [Lysobacter lactosilyticus]MCC8363834.1 hypothetical protein [Lysobacter lactosilyticus]